MKKLLPIALFSLTAFACSKSNQPKCTDEIVKLSLKEILAENGTVDTSVFILEGISTTDKDEEFRMCECTANVVTEVVDENYIPIDKPYDYVDDEVIPKKEYRFPITYKAQITDDGESINVQIL